MQLIRIKAMMYFLLDIILFCLAHIKLRCVFHFIFIIDLYTVAVVKKVILICKADRFWGGDFIKQLIINADDFGLHEKINQGIIEAHLQGCVTSATIMPGGDAFQNAVLLAQKCPKLSVGVHLTLVGVNPVAHGNIKTLLNKNGTFHTNYREFICSYVQGKISKQDIEYELRCQMQKVVGNGINISHIDSHQHLHVLPGIADIIAKLADEFHVKKIRIPAESSFFFAVKPLSIGRILARNVLTGCAIYAHRQYRKKGLSSTQYFFGMLSGGKMTIENLKAVITNLPDGVSEIMVHPGSSNIILSALYDWKYHWQEELEALKNQEILRTIKEKDIKLTNYWEVFDEAV